jgi:hypothetical protein
MLDEQSSRPPSAIITTRADADHSNRVIRSLEEELEEAAAKKVDDDDDDEGNDDEGEAEAEMPSLRREEELQGEEVAAADTRSAKQRELQRALAASRNAAELPDVLTDEQKEGDVSPGQRADAAAGEEESKEREEKKQEDEEEEAAVAKAIAETEQSERAERLFRMDVAHGVDGAILSQLKTQVRTFPNILRAFAVV